MMHKLSSVYVGLLIMGSDSWPYRCGCPLGSWSALAIQSTVLTQLTQHTHRYYTGCVRPGLQACLCKRELTALCQHACLLMDILEVYCFTLASPPRQQAPEQAPQYISPTGADQQAMPSKPGWSMGQVGPAVQQGTVQAMEGVGAYLGPMGVMLEVGRVCHSHSVQGVEGLLRDG